MINSMFSQNELYIKGNVADPTKPTLYVKGNDGSNPTLYVKGEIVNDNGVFQNEDGDIELTGNWTNTVGAGASKYESTGEEKFSGTANQTITGTFNGTTDGSLNSTTSGINQFYNVKLVNNTTLTLATDVNVHSNGTTEFVGNTVVVTGTNVYYVRNSATGAISAYGAAGSTTKFFQGNLWRQAINGVSYDLPVGYSRASTGAFGEGIQLATINITAATGTGVIESRFNNGSPSTTPITICPGAPTPEARDVDDILNNGFWTIHNSGSITEFDITLAPADYTALATPGDYTIIQDGNPTGFDDCTGALTGLPITHSGLSSFSKWEIGASTDGAPLPVELVYLDAYGVNNEFIQVAWETATEINNKGFDIQRSVDGISFEKIGFVEGNGNTTEVKNYTFDDKNVVQNTIYYYRLKQIDFDDNFELTYKVSASLKGIQEEIFVSPFIPNPTTTNSHIEIQVPNETTAKVVMFNGIGQVIYNNRVALDKGINVLPFDLNNLASGIYQTTITINEKTYSRKLLFNK